MIDIRTIVRAFLTSAPSLVRLNGMVRYPWALTVMADARATEMMENFMLASGKGGLKAEQDGRGSVLKCPNRDAFSAVGPIL